MAIYDNDRYDPRTDRGTCWCNDACGVVGEGHNEYHGCVVRAGEAYIQVAAPRRALYVVAAYGDGLYYRERAQVLRALDVEARDAFGRAVRDEVVAAQRDAWAVADVAAALAGRAPWPREGAVEVARVAWHEDPAGVPAGRAGAPGDPQHPGWWLCQWCRRARRAAADGPWYFLRDVERRLGDAGY